MSKTKIEDIRADGETVFWRVGTDRFHVWVRKDGPEDTVYKNSIAKFGEPGYYTTRRLTREGSKVAAAMFNEVWAVVESECLIAKAVADDKAKIERFARINVAQAKLREIEQQVLVAFREGQLNASAIADCFHLQYTNLQADIAAEKAGDQ